MAQSGSDTAQRFVIAVSMQIKHERLPEFLKFVNENAKASVRDEPGCFRFDVLISHDKASGDIFLYEIYKDRAAFDFHLTTSHFKRFDEATRDLIISKTINMYAVNENYKP